MTDSGAFRCVADELTAAIRIWEEEGGEWSEAVFDDLARASFQLQYDGIKAYRRYCERRGVTPAGVTRWTDVPPTPVAAFRHVSLIVGGERATRLEFLTSGTTGGPASRGRHLVRDPDLYRASMEAAFHQLVLSRVRGSAAPPAPTPGPVMFGSLVPPFTDDGGSSLAWMIDGLMERFGAPGSRHFASPSGIDWDAAGEFVARAVAENRPVCVLATTLALDVWVRYLRDRDQTWKLPAGSILMDTGGAKGREDVNRADVCRGAAARLGIDPARVVNEFGMTELLSQLYTVDDGPWLRGPPWLKVRALNPNDLEPVRDGDPGILCYYDLANLGSVCAVLTEDVGRVSRGAVQWLHRFPGAPPRGCSLATAELLAAQEDRSGD